MLSKSQINFIKSLEQKKQRKAFKLFLAEGVKIVNELLISNYKIDSVFATKEWLKNNIGKLLSKQIVNVFEITADELKKISLLTSPNQVLALVKIPNESDPVESDLIVALESIRDPGNLGTIIRICDWFGISTLICSPDCADFYNPKVIQSTMGSFTRVQLIEYELHQLKKLYPDHHIYGASLNGNNIFHCKPEKKSVLVIGNESAGISESLMKHLDSSIMIPRYGKAESLNAAVACGIIVNYFRSNLQ